MIWKILFVIYTIVIFLMSFLGLGNAELSGQKVTFYNAIGTTFIELILVLALIYTFALGWKKRLVSERFNKYFFKFSLIAFIFVGVCVFINSYEPMHSDMILHAMQQGMVPRHWDFQILLAMTRVEVFLFAMLTLFLIFGPFYLGYYHYTKQMTNLEVAQYSGRKCFATYSIFSYILVFAAIFFGLSGNYTHFNIFDSLSVLSGIYMALGLFGYAFQQEIFNQSFWRITLPVCVFIELLPTSFFSIDFKDAVGITTTQASPVYILATCIMTAVAIYMIYQYASTDVVFKKRTVI